MGKIYLGPKSFFKLPNPRSKTKKAIVNAIAQAVDFLDGDTVVKIGKKFVKAKFNYAYGKGLRNVSWINRFKIIWNYAPKSVKPDLLKIHWIITQYAKGEISKRKVLEFLKKLERKYGLKGIVEKVLRKD